MDDQVCMERVERLETTNNGSVNQITIHKVLNGYLVNVGCKQVVFETREKLIDELDRYFKCSKDVEKEYLEKYK